MGEGEIWARGGRGEGCEAGGGVGGEVAEGAFGKMNGTDEMSDGHRLHSGLW